MNFEFHFRYLKSIAKKKGKGKFHIFIRIRRTEGIKITNICIPNLFNNLNPSKIPRRIVYDPWCIYEQTNATTGGVVKIKKKKGKKKIIQNILDSRIQKKKRRREKKFLTVVNRSPRQSHGRIWNFSPRISRISWNSWYQVVFDRKFPRDTYLNGPQFSTPDRGRSVS